MKYPMKEHKVIVTYNLNIKNEIPIVKAKVILNIETGELEKFDPNML